MITQTKGTNGRPLPSETAWTDECVSDEELLDRFLRGESLGAEAAFKALVCRHGPMVLGVCRQVLNQLDDADDACQATFLVLARNAGSIRQRRLLGRWLYEVAYRIAIRARMRTVRRKDQEREAAVTSDLARRPEFDPAWHELRPVLHEEVNRLPEKYRSAVVLCYLEGRTNEEAAEILRWPVGTVKGRLSRARELLRSRLTRRGMALSAAFLLLRLSRETIFAEVVPATLIENTVRNAVALSQGMEASALALSDRVVELANDSCRVLKNPFGGQFGRRTVRLLAASLVVVVLFGAFFWSGELQAALLSSFAFRPGGSGASGACH
jgi:RNA polymerase sigma factor (sigma-70 family)